MLSELDPCARSEHELFSATNLLLGMLNGVAVPSFPRTPDDARVLGAAVESEIGEAASLAVAEDAVARFASALGA